MAKYMQIAEQANEVAKELYTTYLTDPDIPKEELGRIASLLGQLYNLGIRTAPRPTQATVGFNAVTVAMKGLPVHVTREVRTDEKTSQTYNVIICNPLTGPGH